MKPLLMDRNRNFDPRHMLDDHKRYGDRDVDPRLQLPPHERALIQDLDLDTLLHAMAGDDEFLFEVAQTALLGGRGNDQDTILFRQQILKDCLKNKDVIRQLYKIAVEAVEGTRRRWWDLSSHYPSSVFYSAIDLLETLSGILKNLRGIAEENAGRFESVGFTVLFGMLVKELSDEYFGEIQTYLTELRFRKGVLLSAQLGEWTESTNLVLRKQPDERQSWLDRMLRKGPPAYTFHLAERDVAGAKILSDLRYRGISTVAIALAQSANHVLSFFRSLRTELAFYVGALRLYELLASKGEPVCFPTPDPIGERAHCFSGLYDVCLSLRMEQRLVGNTLDADDKSLVVITGSNQGGKSNFLRSVGLAQLMMQCGMFVGAEAFKAGICPALFTHFKREEDTTMKSGKFDEELARMSEIADHITPDSMLLFNESFAATNEREGSEIAKQIVSALLERRIKIFYVSHLYEFARSLFEKKIEGTLFLRAERKTDGTRTFQMFEAEPLETSYGVDLYRQVFGFSGQNHTSKSDAGLSVGSLEIEPR